MTIEKTPEIQKILETLEGKDVNEIGDDGVTPLVKASWDGNTDVVKALLLAGADVNKKVMDGSTALLVVSYGAMPIGETEGTDEKILKQSLEKKEKSLLEIVKLLLSHGADVNAENNEGLTPLMASVQGMPTEMKQLIASAAEWVSNPREYYEQMAEEWNKITPDHTAISVALIEAGANVNAQNANGATPLIYAVENNNKQMVKILLDAGADVTRTTRQGYSALDIAREYDREDIFRLLTGKGGAAAMDNRAQELADLACDEDMDGAVNYINSFAKDEKQADRALEIWKANREPLETQAVKAIADEMKNVRGFAERYYLRNDKWPSSLDETDIEIIQQGVFQCRTGELKESIFDESEKRGSFGITVKPFLEGCLITATHKSIFGENVNLYILTTGINEYRVYGTTEPKMINGKLVSSAEGLNPVLKNICEEAGFAG